MLAEAHTPESDQEEAREAFLRSLDPGVPFFSDEPGDRAQRDAYLDRYLEALAGLEKSIAENRRVAENRKAMIDRWLSSENERAEREAAWLRRQIEAFAAGYDYGKKRSRNLPHGTFGVRKAPDQVVITDPAKALEFAEGNGVEIRVVREVQKKPLAAFVAEHTDFQPDPEEDGWEIAPGAEQFYIKPILED